MHRLVLHDLPTAVLGTYLALFPIVNPFGGIPFFFALTTGYGERDRNITALKTACYVFLILVFFLFLGRFVLSFFGLSLPVLRIAGGLIVAHSAWNMVTGESRVTAAEGSEAATKDEIALTPMAMPMLSGPGSIGVVIGMAATTSNWFSYIGMVVAIAALAVTVFLFLRLGGPLVARLGPTATGAINRIFGFLILSIAVQLIWDGLAEFQFMK
jgi:multiple antibiotic resistance protein